MSASEKILEPQSIERLAVIAGGGAMPAALLEACDQKNIQTFVVAFEDQADPNLVEGREHMWSNPGAAGAIIKALKKQGIKDLVLIGSVRRPSLSELKPDLKTAEFLARVGMSAMGDNGFLTSIRTFLKKEGFEMHGMHKFAQDLLAPEGVLTKAKPSKADQIDIQKGFEVSQEIGRLDIGQAVVVQEGLVLAVEAIEGTDELLLRSKDLKRKGAGGVLVKTCKPQQDRDLDLPTIGPETIKNAAACGLSGVAVHAGQSLILNREEVIELANQNKIFVVGI